MQFELTEALINDILFSMEDQERNFFIDSREGVVAGGAEEFEAEQPLDKHPAGSDGNRYIPIPHWDSSDGFRLMERFAAQLHNPIVRDELSAALNRGKGVFRAFKDILGRYPEAEHLWFTYKERKMKKEIIRWYNGLREEWGMQRIGGEPEETGDLILEDFRFRPSEGLDREAAAELHDACRRETDTAGSRTRYEADFPGNPLDCADLALTAETVGGDFAGYIMGIRREAVLHIAALEVKPEYRGLGIGEALISRFLERVDRQNTGISIDLPAEAEGFSCVLHRIGFRSASVRYCINPENMPS
ncbi:MAG: GNAT family N-acetyltransferase [Treponema sp.]|nr:GNAT family N-acetyltransferase [Treponema sp.]